MKNNQKLESQLFHHVAVLGACGHVAYCTAGGAVGSPFVFFGIDWRMNGLVALTLCVQFYVYFNF